MYNRAAIDHSYSKSPTTTTLVANSNLNSDFLGGSINRNDSDKEINENGNNEVNCEKCHATMLENRRLKWKVSLNRVKHYTIIAYIKRT